MKTLEARPAGRTLAHAGFTLVELLLVVAILGILATVVVVNVSGHTEKTRIATTRQSIAAICLAIDTYEVSNGTFPDSLDQVTVGTDETAAMLKKDQLNDSWGTAFQYKRSSKLNYEVRSAGPDKQMGSADDLTNPK